MSGDPGPIRPEPTPLPPAAPASGAPRPRPAFARIRHLPALALPALALLALATATACAPSPDEMDDGKLPATDLHCAPDAEGIFPDTADPEVDYDCDGWPKTEDCNNRNSEVHPSAPEFNNGVDDDCDGDAGLLYGCGAGGNEGVGVGALLLLGLARRRRLPTPRLRRGDARGLPCDPPRDGAP